MSSQNTIVLDFTTLKCHTFLRLFPEKNRNLAVFKHELVFMEVHSLGSKANIARQVMLFPPAHRVQRVKRDLAQGWTPTIRGSTTDGLTQNLCTDAKIWKCQNKIKHVS